MSTEHQKYSTENQLDEIRSYAEKHRIEKARIYQDEGKSDLTIAERDALKQMIEMTRRVDGRITRSSWCMMDADGTLPAINEGHAVVTA